MRPITLLGLLFSLVGCSDPPTDLTAGEACVRTSQCAAGLACVIGVCSTDLGPLAEAGMVPPLDAMAEAGPMDAAIDGPATDGPLADAPVMDARLDATVDATVDAMVDATVDATVDAMVDANVDGG